MDFIDLKFFAIALTIGRPATKKMSCLGLLFFISSILMHLFTIALAQSLLTQFCIRDSGTYTNNSAYQANLDSLLAAFSNATVDYGFYNSSAGQLKAFALCKGDLTPNTCRICIGTSSDELRGLCPNYKEAYIYYDNCILGYSNRSIFSIDKFSPIYVAANAQNFSDVNRTNQVLPKLLSNLKDEAASGGPLRKYAVGEATVGSETIYALVQCTPDLQKQQCTNCLDDLNVLVPKNLSEGKNGLTAIAPICNFRYEVYRFYQSRPDAPSSFPSPTGDSPPAAYNNTTRNGKDSNKLRVVLITIVPTIVLVLLIIPIWVTLRRPHGKKVENDDEVLHVESLLFNLGTIKFATDNFSDANKLGRGGFGDVYKGILSDGQAIAVKRLSISSNQGEQEFKNEVLFLAKLQHRNLIKLLGFCLEAGEKLLIYELVPNSSLDHFIFDPTNRACLDWEKRYAIIRGIARGLLYLHEDSHFRIIHRDLKASNILLDVDMNPKISDFGLAKLFALDQTQANTRRIAGTYGFMAPEYAYHGHFSVKSDVYSFGVLVLEIVSGRKASSQNGEELDNLVGYAWRKWREGTILDIVDPTLQVDSRSKIMRCLHIGLLCVQESVANRPTMSLVLSMLDSNHSLLPTPLRPGFLMHSTTQEVEHNSQISGSQNSTQFSVNGVSISELYPR